MNKQKQNSAITLIALIITVIILLILAGVSINFIFGQEGIFNKTQTVADKYNKAEAEETINLKLAQINMTYYSDYQRKATLQEIANKLCTDEEVEYLNAGKLLGAVEPIDLTGYSSFFVKLKAYAYEFEIGDDIQIASINVSGEPGVDESGRGDTFGQVISGPKAGGSYNNPYIPTGFTHTVGDGTWNNGYTIKETATGNEFVWVPCIVKDGVTSNQIEEMENGDKVITFGKTLTYKSSNSLIIIGENTSTSELIETSVGNYGGFYIGKYEAGVPLDTNGSEITTNLNTAETVAKKARSVPDATVWTSISRANAEIAAGNMIDSTSTGANSALVSGACWDTTLQWMVNTSENKDIEPNRGYDVDTSGKGILQLRNKNVFKSSVTNVVNNIYNMAGNAGEWSLEYWSGQNYGIYRGGSTNDFGDVTGRPVSSRTHFSSNGAIFIGFRVVLYK